MDANAALFSFGFITVLSLIGGAIYFLPTILAGLMKRSNVLAIGLINLLIGWSILGWVIALIMAVWKKETPVQHVIYQHNPQTPSPTNPPDTHNR